MPRHKPSTGIGVCGVRPDVHACMHVCMHERGARLRVCACLDVCAATVSVLVQPPPFDNLTRRGGQLLVEEQHASDTNANPAQERAHAGRTQCKCRHISPHARAHALTCTLPNPPPREPCLARTFTIFCGTNGAFAHEIDERGEERKDRHAYCLISSTISSSVYDVLLLSMFSWNHSRVLPVCVGGARMFG